MKRVGRLYEAILEPDNLKLALLKALRGKRNSAAALAFCRDVPGNLGLVRQRLASLEPRWGSYRLFRISDPKPRTIAAASFPERVMHHALVNVLEPVFERQQICHSYACRPGKGTHAAVLRAFHLAKSGGCFLKLDVRKYFDSVSHEVVRRQLGRLVKDQPVLRLFATLLDSYHTAPGRGLPIGNLTSQHLANLYLSGLDHYVLEQLTLP
jgi:RNA-directed DNA polymerase